MSSNVNTSFNMPSAMPAAPQYSYPPLDEMSSLSALHDARPYMTGTDRDFQQLAEADYEHHDMQHEPTQYPSPSQGPSDNPYNPQQTLQPAPDARMEMPGEAKSESDAPTPGRTKSIIKPDRPVTKNSSGRFCCDWPGCTDDTKDFNRKCEWTKHMDKHERPYKCPAEGCEKLPGFTYSGGLLRHEREVHNKHGGPKKQLNCPHVNCKRHVGKGFSRQENLNEHLRRVHTDAGAQQNGDETEEDAGDVKTGQKRKRSSGQEGEEEEVREEVQRLRQENMQLRQQIGDMNHQIQQLSAQTLQAALGPRMQAPAATMI